MKIQPITGLIKKLVQKKSNNGIKAGQKIKVTSISANPSKRRMQDIGIRKGDTLIISTFSPSGVVVKNNSTSIAMNKKVFEFINYKPLK